MDEYKKKPTEYYCNNIVINTSAYDCIIDFGKENITDQGEVELEKGVRMRMSPQLMKTFSNILKEAVSQYESSYGAINNIQEDSNNRE